MNPDREVDRGALEVHGIEDEFLATAAEVRRGRRRVPRVRERRRARHSQRRLRRRVLEPRAAPARGVPHQIRDCCAVLDTLALARRMHPGQRNSLDALAKRYNVDNSKRELHGALLDAQILADIYLVDDRRAGEPVARTARRSFALPRSRSEARLDRTRARAAGGARRPQRSIALTRRCSRTSRSAAASRLAGARASGRGSPPPRLPRRPELSGRRRIQLLGAAARLARYYVVNSVRRRVAVRAVECRCSTD